MRLKRRSGCWDRRYHRSKALAVQKSQIVSNTNIITWKGGGWAWSKDQNIETGLWISNSETWIETCRIRKLTHRASKPSSRVKITERKVQPAKTRKLRYPRANPPPHPRTRRKGPPSPGRPNPTQAWLSHPAFQRRVLPTQTPRPVPYPSNRRPPENTASPDRVHLDPHLWDPVPPLWLWLLINERAGQDPSRVPDNHQVHVFDQAYPWSNEAGHWMRDSGQTVSRVWRIRGKEDLNAKFFE